MKFPWFKSKSEIPPFIRGVEVYYDDTRFLLCPAMRTSSAQFNGPGTPYQIVDRSVSDTALGEMILDSLPESRSDFTHEEFENEVGQVFRVAGVKSWNGLPKKWSYIEICEVKSELTITPLHRGLQGGYSGILGDPVFHSPMENAEVGAKVHEAASAFDDEPVDMYDGDDNIGHY